MIKMKPKAGFYGITGCAGCLLSVIFNEDELLSMANALDIVSFPFIKEKNSEGRMVHISVLMTMRWLFWAKKNYQKEEEFLDQ